MLSPMTPWLDLAATPILAAVLWAIARIDAATFRIPDRLSLPLIAAGLGLAALRIGGIPWEALLGAGLGYAGLAALGTWIYRRRGVEALGLGDAKLVAAGGAWLGAAALPWLILLSAGSALIWALATRNTSGALAFGPWIAAAFFALWVGKCMGLHFL